MLLLDVMGPNLNYRFIVCYRPPEYDKNYLVLLMKAFKYLSLTDASLIITGDLYLPNIFKAITYLLRL
jgi:hypothetical protein